jgi:hypothetical protein
VVALVVAVLMTIAAAGGVVWLLVTAG